MRFRAVLQLEGKTATGIHVPAEVVAGLGPSRRPAVRATLNGYTYRSTVAPMRGMFMLPVAAAIREAAGISAGEEVEVELEPDTEPREVQVPPDFAAELNTAAGAAAAFAALSYSGRLRYVQSIEGAKTAETRRRRIDAALKELQGSPKS